MTVRVPNELWQRVRMTADEWTTRISSPKRSRSSTSFPGSTLRLGDLEPRIMFSATPIDPAMMMGGGETPVIVQTQVHQNSGDSDQSTSIQSVAETQSFSNSAEIIFIDSAVPEIQKFLDDLSASGRDADVYVLDADRDGMDQISEILDGRSGIQSIHIISHAENSAIKLGNTWLGAATIDGYAAQVATWQSSLTSDADILLYGCEIAQTEDGRQLVESLAALSGADVAASDNDTGHAQFGSDWRWEYTTGSIESTIAVTQSFQDTWNHKLATITVTTLVDEQTSNGLTSFREAIAQANNGDTILVGAGTYQLTIDTLTINEHLTIVGTDARTTIIDADGLGKRVFRIGSSANVTMSGMTIQGGDQDGGGGIRVENSASLTLSQATLQNNTADQGGAIFVRGSLSMDRVLLQ